MSLFEVSLQSVHMELHYLPAVFMNGKKEIEIGEKEDILLAFFFNKQIHSH